MQQQPSTDGGVERKTEKRRAGWRAILDTDYAPSRRAQVGLTVAGIHCLHQLFCAQNRSGSSDGSSGGTNESAMSKHVKSLGMSLIQILGPARRFVVQVACHGVAIASRGRKKESLLRRVVVGFAAQVDNNTYPTLASSLLQHSVLYVSQSAIE